MISLQESLLDDEEDILNDDNTAINELLKGIDARYKEKYKTRYKGPIFTYDKDRPNELNMNMPEYICVCTADIKKLITIIPYETLNINNPYSYASNL